MTISARKALLAGAATMGLMTVTGPTASNSRQVTVRPVSETIMRKPPAPVPRMKILSRTALRRLTSSPPSFVDPIPQATGATDPETTRKLIIFIGSVGLCHAILGILGGWRKED